MAVVPMQKVAVVAHRSEREKVLEFLHKEGVMEISDAREVTNIDHPEVHFRTAELDHVILRLTEFASKDTLSMLGKKVSDDACRKAALEHDIRGIIDQVHAMEQEETEIKRAIHDLEHGRLPSLRPSADMNAAEEGAYFTSSKVREDLSHFGGAEAGLSPSQMEEHVKIELATAQKNHADHQATLMELSKELPTLVNARRFVAWLDEKAAARESMKHTKSTVTLFGWIAAHTFEPIERRLADISPATAVVKVEPKADEQAPVLLKNPFWLKPFESVTTLYGLPQSSEIDPTPLLAPFFILFFGLCLTDAGYGLVLAAVMALYLWKKKLSIDQAPLWWLLFIGGLMTVLISIPFGGWFGMDPNVIGKEEWAAPFVKVVGTAADGTPIHWFKGQLWNLGETKGITFFQNLALVLGVIHLSFGIFMAGVMKWRVGERVAAFMNDWTALVLFATIAAYFLVIPAEYKSYGLYGIYAATALLLIGKGWGATWYLVPVYGLLGVLNLAMSMLSNTLSYLRLLALGLVTGALALAVNLVAQQFGALLPWFLGIPVSIIIYIVGHTLNIALNVLGAFIHSGRLQFVEFFGNFFEGGGRPYKPFRRSVHDIR